MNEQSLGQMLENSYRQWASKPAALIHGKSGFEPISYSEHRKLVQRYARQIDSLGLHAGDRVVIQSENCFEWALTDWACLSLGLVVVPIYPTLLKEASQYIVQDSGAKVVISGSSEQAEKMEGLDVRTVLLRGGPSSLSEQAQAGEPIDEQRWAEALSATSASDLATIIYTSGTTGEPKGAMLTHRCFTFICEAVLKSLPITHQDTFLGFLPLSHVYERAAGHILPIGVGATIAYSPSLRTLSSDMVAVKPTIMLAVPRFLDAMRTKILEGAQKQPWLRRKLFELALSQGKKRLRGEFAPLAPLLDRIVGAKIRQRTGGRLRFFVSGGAAMPMHVYECFGALGMTVLQGYGLTETTGATTINHPDRNNPTTVGEPLPGMELRIASDGEILIRGPARMEGYWNRPEDTAAAIDAEGWFHTGDIGELVRSSLKITDRKKDILVLGNGKNVAPQPIENKLKESALIQEAVLFGDGMESVVALIVPEFDLVRKQMSDSGHAIDPSAPLSSSSSAKELIKKEVERVNKTLADFEKVKRHTILDKGFSVESGELTPSLKVKRRVVRDRFDGLISEMSR